MRRSTVRRATTVLLPVLVGAAVASRRRWQHWGATAAERAATYPGDDLVPEPADSITRAVGIGAPPEVVWQWLVQIGQGRGGMYSYDWLENLLGLDIHSAEELRDEWQHLAPGDRVVVVPAGRLGMRDGYSFPVAAVSAPHHLVLRQAPPEHPWNAVWTFVVEPDGGGGARLVSRSRATRPSGPAGAALRGMTALMDPVTLVMTRKMLLGIKARAERA